MNPKRCDIEEIFSRVVSKLRQIEPLTIFHPANNFEAMNRGIGMQDSVAVGNEHFLKLMFNLKRIL